jgi:hypothetical protein
MLLLVLFCLVGWFVRRQVLSSAAAFFAGFGSAAGQVSVPHPRLGLSVRWRPARHLFTFTRSVLAGLCFPALWFNANCLALAWLCFRAHGLFSSQVWFSHLLAAVPNRSFNRTGNGLRRCLPSLALGAG